MSLKITFRSLLILLFVGLYSLSAKANDDEFAQDSLQIVKNSEALLQQTEIQSVDSVEQFLNRNLKNPNSATDDFIQFCMAKHFYLTQQIPIAKRIINKNIEDDYNEGYSDAKFYNIQGAVFSAEKEYKKAISSFLRAAYYYQKQGNRLKEHSIYNNVANIYLALGDQKRAYEYSYKCYNEYKNHKEHPNYLSFLGVLAVCESNLGMLDSAEMRTAEGLKRLKNTQDIKGDILINYAKSEIEYKKGNYHPAIPYGRKSLTLSEKYNLNEYEIISSIILMKIHNKLKEFKLALSYGETALELSRLSNNTSILHSISDGMAKAHAGLEEFEKAYIFKSQSDSLKTIDRDEKNKRSIDSLLVQFESLSNKNKILGQEVIIATQNHTLERRSNTLIIISFTLLILILFIIGLFFFNKQRLRLVKNRQEVELINAVSASEEEERKRLSSLLHDGLAAELTALKLELEQNKDVSQRSFFMLEKAHELTRRISHNLSPYMIEEKGLVEAVAYLVSNNNINKNIYFYSNVTSDLKIAPRVASILFRSTQELLQNAIKHAKASEIVVQIILRNNILTISVEDDGVGMDTSIIDDSVGLGSLKKRIEVINGELNIDSSLSRGTSAFIKLKLKK